MTTKSARLIDLLKEDGHVDENRNAQVDRLYPGYWQRSEGAWSWMLTDDGVSLGIGSQWPVTYLLDHRPWELGSDGSIYPTIGESKS